MCQGVVVVVRIRIFGMGWIFRMGRWGMGWARGGVLTILRGEPILSGVLGCQNAGSGQISTLRRLTVKVTHWAETHYIDIVPHNPLGPVSAAACVNLCMASTNVGVQEMLRCPGSFGGTTGR